jgi:hypothetical protein
MDRVLFYQQAVVVSEVEVATLFYLLRIRYKRQAEVLAVMREMLSVLPRSL